MKILFDQGTPAPLRRWLPGHVVETAFECGWHLQRNGDLLTAAEAAGFNMIVTTDRSLRYQQNLTGRSLSIVVLMTTDWRLIRHHTEYVARAIDALPPGAYTELPFPPA